jgi:hypothetical protein
MILWIILTYLAPAIFPMPMLPPPPLHRPHPKEAIGADENDPKIDAFQVPSSIRKWYRNPDGSCVQCSIGLCGADQDVAEAATLLWDSEYGPKERGGSEPTRVGRYAASRKISLWNITGSPASIDWAIWACETGRGCALGAGGSHFQTLVGYIPSTKTWHVVNNNSTDRVDVYTDEQFRRLHAASGPWTVVLCGPPHPCVPEYVEWWRSKPKR